MKVETAKHGPVWTVTINRPEVRNAIDRETALALKQVFTAFEADPEALAAVLTGADGAFCAGADLKALATAGTDFYQPEGDGPLGPTRMLLAKPVIAAVEGPAVAGGLELALWCDLRVASETAVFGVYCRRWGVPLVDGGTVRLPRLIGAGRALDMILTGRPVDAREAQEWGLANRLVAAGEARAAAEDVAHELARFPQTCLRADRLSAHRQWDFDLAEALKNEGRGGLGPLRSEAQGGAARFTAGRGRRGSFDDI